MGKGRGRYKQGRHPGLVPRNHPRSVRWAVDFDYLADLSPAEREWLGQFADAHYKADPAAMDTWPVEDKRAVYRRKNAANRDAYTATDDTGTPVTFLGTPTREPEADPSDQAPTPEYLDTPEYKAARAEYRDQLHPTSERHPAEPTKALERARRKLRSTTEELP